MTDLPQTTMYALRHGVTNRIWVQCDGGRWLWPTRESLRKSWDAMKEAGLVQSEFREHKIVTIRLMEVDHPRDR